MSRCIACDSILTDEELYETQPDGTPENMCRTCRGVKSVSKDSEEEDWREFDYDEW